MGRVRAGTFRSHQMFGQYFGQIFDYILGQVFDQVVWIRKFSVQVYWDLLFKIVILRGERGGSRTLQRILKTIKTRNDDYSVSRIVTFFFIVIVVTFFIRFRIVNETIVR